MPRLAVLGQPVSHSRSPAMQNAALRELGLADWSYEAIEVGRQEFPELVHSLAAGDFAGVNVTVPHKLAALEVAATASAAARDIGAANTLSFGDVTHADNTDAVGLIEALPHQAAGLRALVLGAGGSARACVWALREAGARVDVWNRTAAKAARLAAEFGVEAVEEVEAARYGLLVNCTTVGLEEANAPHEPARGLKGLPLAADSFTEEHIVVDLVYGSRPTSLAAIAADKGASVIDGLEILVHQGAASLRLWTGHEPPIEAMRAAATDQGHR